ncbi:MAG: hypothetical protein BWK80_10065 [Desulfobacteraceae bacterium IS3]|nr:MAG: hypothetical protein BWK80_10065 [Desulfobacteraceae bacterium IS3]
MLKKIYMIPIILFLTFPMALHADDASRVAAAEKLLSVMNLKEMTAQILSQIKDMQMAQIMNTVSSEKDRADSKVFQGKMMDFLTKELSWENLKGDYVNLYAEVFTEEELKGLTDFHSSPIGQKYLKKTPELMRRSMQISQERMMKILPEIQKMTQEWDRKQKTSE